MKVIYLGMESIKEKELTLKENSLMDCLMAKESQNGKMVEDMRVIIFFINFYLGDWKAGKRHGFGMMFYPNGDIFEGDYESDK